MGGALEILRLAFKGLGARVAPHLTALWIFVPIALLALILAGYGWWWRIVADGVRQNATDLQTAQRALGRELTWDALSIEGFPYRVEATISAPRFTAPDRGAEWDGERIVVHVQPLALNHIGFSLEGRQRLFYVKDGTWVEGDASADSALVTMAQASGAQHADLSIGRLAGKAKVNATEFNFIVDEAEGDLSVSGPSEREPLPRIEFTGELKNVALQGNFDLPLGPSIALISVDAGLKFPTDLPEASPTTLFAAWRKGGTPIELRKFALDWGGITVAASGEFKLDAQSLPEGSFLLKLGNHPRILELLENYGWITKETRAAAKPVLDVLAFASGDPERRISVPMRIEKGNVYLGPARVATLRPAEPADPAEPAQPPELVR